MEMTIYTKLEKSELRANILEAREAHDQTGEPCGLALRSTGEPVIWWIDEVEYVAPEFEFAVKMALR